MQLEDNFEFETFDSKFGPVERIRIKGHRIAIEHVIECIQIAQEVGSDIISLWLADGTNYPGQDDLRRRRHRLHVGRRPMLPPQRIIPGCRKRELQGNLHPLPRPNRRRGNRRHRQDLQLLLPCRRRLVSATGIILLGRRDPRVGSGGKGPGRLVNH